MTVASGDLATMRRRAASRRRLARRARDTGVAYAMLAPALLVIGAFSLVPVVWALVLSFNSGGMLGGEEFTGLENYRLAFQNPFFLSALKNTVIYAALAVPCAIALALAVALVIFHLPWGQGFFRGTVYFPVIVPAVVAANVWAYLVNRDFGPVNYALSALHLPAPDWLGTPGLAIPAIAAMEVWRGFGYYVLVFAAALLSIPREMYEAARIDGAGELRVIARVTIPLLRPALGYAVVVATIWNLQLFDAIYVLTRGGPAGATATVGWYVYQQAFDADNVGLASTMSMVLLAVVLGLSILQLRFFRGELEY